MSFTRVTLDDSGNSIDHATTSPLGDRPQSEADLIRTRVGGTVHSVTMSDKPEYNRSTSVAPTRVTQDQLAASGRILDNAHTPAGQPIPRANVQGHHIVSVLGMTMRAQDAAAAGYLEVTPEGRYVEVGGAREVSGESEEPAPAPQTSTDYDVSDPDRDQKFLEAVVTADPSYAGDLHNETIDAAVNGTGTAFDAERVASALGITPAQAQTRFAGVVETFQSHVDSKVTAAGVPDAQEFYSYLRAERPDALRDALRKVAHDGNTSDFEGMARAYVEQGHAPTYEPADAAENYAADDLLGAEFGSGISAGQGSDGTVFLLIPGRGVVKATDAIRDGLVKVSR